MNGNDRCESRSVYSEPSYYSPRGKRRHSAFGEGGEKDFSSQRQLPDTIAKRGRLDAAAGGKYPADTRTTTTSTTNTDRTAMRNKFRKKKRNKKKKKRKEDKLGATPKDDFMNGFVEEMSDGKPSAKTERKTSGKAELATETPTVAKPQMTTTVKAKTTTPVTLDDVVAIDCEMVGVGWKMESALARCSVIDSSGTILMDTYVIPPSGISSITDYRTPYSGVRPHNMHGATPFRDAVRRARSLIEGKVVVGHGLKGDFDALGFRVPDERVRDTLNCPGDRLFILSQERESQMKQTNQYVQGPKLCRRLKSLSYYVLGRTIQKGRGGHDSVEDAKATMDLYLAVREEWESGLISGKFAANSLLQGRSGAGIKANDPQEDRDSLKRNKENNSRNEDEEHSTRLYRALAGSGGGGGGGGGEEEDGGGIKDDGEQLKNGRVDHNSYIDFGNMGGVRSDGDVGVHSSYSSSRRRSRTVTVTSEEMTEYVGDRYWSDFPEDEVMDG